MPVISRTLLTIIAIVRVSESALSPLVLFDASASALLSLVGNLNHVVRIANELLLLLLLFLLFLFLLML